MAFLGDEQALLEYAAKHYRNAFCNTEREFLEDFDIPRRIKKLFNKYKRRGIINERLALNHFILFFNVFEGYAGVRILFYRCDETDRSILKSFLVFLNRCPDFIEEVDTSTIITDGKIMEKLKKL